MIANLDSAISLFESLPESDRARVLGEVSHYLTIIARAICTEGTYDQQREKLIAINEIHHRALAQMLAYLAGRKDRYSDREILLILLDTAKNAGIRRDLQIAFEKALGRAE